MLEYPDLSAKPSEKASWASEGNVFFYPKPITLESGESLPELKLMYSTYGTYNPADNNVIWVCHALTANANVLEWWKDLFGIGKLYDPEKYFIICVNVPGSCYGSSSPLDVNPLTGSPYFHHFPKMTIRDIISTFEILRNHLNINKIHTCIGGSLGGQQALEWAIINPKLIQNLVLLATNARTSPWGIALNETQRMAIANDPTWVEYIAEAGINGMKVARAIALLSYRSYTTYNETQEDPIDAFNEYRAITYQKYQAEKFATRFNAYAYWALTYILDSHNVGRKRGSVHAALQLIQSKTLIIGIESDLLFPVDEQKYLAENIKNATIATIKSIYGHDGFLVESEKIDAIIRNFYNS
ncbi:MAG: homoserine O-acetyltransferase [Bacteroidota bacterium]|nr:homoserine O-acetyltransferase [Bacteroidota bacterium]